MQKKNYKGRCVKRSLSKCKGVCRTYTPLQEAYNENILLLNEHNVELKNVIDIDNPVMTTISSSGFGFWDWLGI